MFWKLFTRQERLALGFLAGLTLLGFAFMGWRRVVPARAFPFTVLEVRVNRATAQELMALPGVGPILAKRIALDRQKNGSYLTLQDLQRVKGITPKTLKKLEGLVRFD